MSNNWKDRAKDYAEDVKDKAEDTLEKAGVPKWLWPSVWAVLAILVLVGVLQFFGQDPVEVTGSPPAGIGSLDD